MDKIKPVLDWIKSHLLITAMSLLIIAFLACGWYYSGALATGLKTEVEARKKEFSKIDKAAKTSVSLPLLDGEFSGNGTLNKQLLDSLSVLSERMSKDVEEARAAALAHNGDPSADAFPGPVYSDRLAQEGPVWTSNASASELRSWRDHESDRRSAGTKRVLVSERIFPSPPMERRENLAIEVHKALVASYDSMLEDAGAGKPPTVQEVETDLTRVQSNFIQRDLSKGTVADLDDDERQRLRDRLGEERLKFYNEAAEKISFYAEPDAFELPEDPFVTKAQHGLGELYDWHWNWWIAEDVISAIMAANTTDDGQRMPVVAAPVKRLVSLVCYDAAPGTGAESGGNSAGSGSGRSPRGGGSRGGSGAAAQDESGPLPEPMISMDVATGTDFNASLTGRASNDLYDVRTVGLRVVVETTRLPELVDALSRQNFITITDISLRPTSAFQAAEYGYMYGAQPVSIVDLTLETLWFRKWTAAWMPESVRNALGVKSAPAGSRG